MALAPCVKSCVDSARTVRVKRVGGALRGWLPAVLRGLIRKVGLVAWRRRA